jgi:hypothetical protein
LAIEEGEGGGEGPQKKWWNSFLSFFTGAKPPPSTQLDQLLLESLKQRLHSLKQQLLYFYY